MDDRSDAEALADITRLLVAVNKGTTRLWLFDPQNKSPLLARGDEAKGITHDLLLVSGELTVVAREVSEWAYQPMRNARSLYVIVQPSAMIIRSSGNCNQSHVTRVKRLVQAMRQFGLPEDCVLELHAPATPELLDELSRVSPGPWRLVDSIPVEPLD